MPSVFLLAAASLALAGLPVSGPALACVSEVVPVGTSNGDGTWHFDLTSTHTCVVQAHGFLSVTDDFELVFLFQECDAPLQCTIEVEGDTVDGNCLRIAAFTVASVHNQNSSAQLCAP